MRVTVIRDRFVDFIADEESGFAADEIGDAGQF